MNRPLTTALLVASLGPGLAQLLSAVELQPQSADLATVTVVVDGMMKSQSGAT